MSQKSKPTNSSSNSFGARVYAVVQTIKKGRTLTYGEVARLAGNPRAARAVGTILSKNWDPAIPCHRVIRADGGMGGYNRGVENKQKILARERTK